MRIKTLTILLLPASLWLAGCNQPSPVASVPPPLPQAAQEPAAFASLPPGAPCSDKIHRYQAVLAGRPEHGQCRAARLSGDRAGAESYAAQACAAGHDGEAMTLIQASEERHGYHV